MGTPATTARRLASLAMVAGALAAALVLAAVDDDGGSGDSGDDGWLAGLFLIVAPLLCAAVTRSVASSTLLRPVGAGAAVLSALASLIHVAVAVDERGAAGYGLGSAAVVSTVLVAVAVALGPRRVGVIGVPPPAGARRPEIDEAELESPQGPPLDVTTPLRDARGHAARSVAAWVAALVIAAVTAPVLLAALGWPRVERRLEARVVDVRTVDGRTAVTFEAPEADHTLRWTRVWDSADWRVGDRRVVFLDDDGRLHADQQFGLAGVPLFMPLLFVGMFTAFAARRLWGLVLALWDAGHGAEPPRLAHTAVIDDPAPRTWRPLVAVWEHDPTADTRLARPDAVYRADDETGEDLQCPASRIVVRRAWVDSGMWEQSKPRWIGVEHGVVVPHRRALFGRWYVRAITRRSEIESLVELHHGPPSPDVETPAPARDRSRHGLAGMVAWRLLAVVAGVALAFVVDDGGERVRIESAVVARPAV